MKRNVKSSGRSPSLLQFADSVQNADQLYFCGMLVPDPFISMRVAGRRVGVFNSLEYGRALKESALDQVLSLEPWQQRAKRIAPNGTVWPADIVTVLARHFGVRAFAVAPDFPVSLADQLRKRGLGIEPVETALFPEREVKTEEEVAAIIAGNRCSAAGIKAAEALLRRAKVSGRKLLVDGRLLTSERVREAIEIACLRSGAVAAHTIVAGGDQACDPHGTGTGPLQPNELIIIDVFPRVTATGYHGDMTRTFLKGDPSDAQAALVGAVKTVHREAIALIKPRADGRRIHDKVCARFETLGFRTTRGPEGASGFIHGTGHGLGLAVHEGPYIGRSGTRLRKGSVVTVEPGLYYPGLGGCRIEDVVQVLPGKPRMLSSYHYRWTVE